MLILSRRTDQRIIIGNDIEITVVELRDGHVRLGITAPKNVQVHRKELLDQIAAENIEAAASASLPDMSQDSDAAEQRPAAAQATTVERLCANGKEEQ